MKRGIKRISAIAMAFTLIGTSTFISKVFSNDTNSVIVSYASDKNKNHGRVGTQTWGPYVSVTFNGRTYSKGVRNVYVKTDSKTYFRIYIGSTFMAEYPYFGTSFSLSQG